MTIILATTRLEPETREREIHCITRPIKWAQLSMWSIPKIDVIILLKSNNSLEYIFM
jgi:hypothetical protein